MIVRSAGGVIFNNGKFLVLRHKDGRFVSPKGHLENQESEIEAAYREIKEESGLSSLELFGYIGIESYLLESGDQKVVTWFLFDALKPEELLLEEETFSSAQWLDFESARAIYSHKSFIDIFEKTQNILLKQ